MTQDASRAFIAIIEADRDRQIAALQEATDAGIKQICREAHGRSRRLQHDTNQRLRREAAEQRHKKLSGTRARLRRQLWQNLKQLQQTISRQVLAKMLAAWADPQWQWHWCHYWLESVVHSDDQRALRVQISADASPATLRRISAWAEQNNYQLAITADCATAGLFIYWQDFELDGSLNAQRHTIESAVLAKLVPLMPQLQDAEA
jgi:hypothetical protein